MNKKLTKLYVKSKFQFLSFICLKLSIITCPIRGIELKFTDTKREERRTFQYSVLVEDILL